MSRRSTASTNVCRISTRCRSIPSSSTAWRRTLPSINRMASIPTSRARRSSPTSCCPSPTRTSTPMPRLFIALPIPDDIADELSTLQSGVPDARWVPAENFHVTLCFCAEVQGAMMRDLEEELSDIAGPPFPVAIAGVEQFSSGKQPKALVTLVEKSDRLEWLQQKVSTVARNCGIEVERRKFRPHVTLARFGNGAETGHHIAQFMASYSTFRAGPWMAQHFALYSSRSGGGGRVYTEEAAYDLTF